MNVYCTRAASCEDKPGYLQNAEGSRDSDSPSRRIAACEGSATAHLGVRDFEIHWISDFRLDF